jgi:hypothetical protein
MPVLMVPDLAPPTAEIAELAAAIFPSLLEVREALAAAWGWIDARIQRLGRLGAAVGSVRCGHCHPREGGLDGIDSDFATLVRTVVIGCVLGALVYATGKWQSPATIRAARFSS